MATSGAHRGAPNERHRERGSHRTSSAPSRQQTLRDTRWLGNSRSSSRARCLSAVSARDPAGPARHSHDIDLVRRERKTSRLKEPRGDKPRRRPNGRKARPGRDHTRRYASAGSTVASHTGCALTCRLCAVSEGLTPISRRCFCACLQPGAISLPREEEPVGSPKPWQQPSGATAAWRPGQGARSPAQHSRPIARRQCWRVPGWPGDPVSDGGSSSAECSCSSPTASAASDRFSCL